MDEFQFGDRAKRPAREPRLRHARSSVDQRLLWLVACLLVVGVVAYVVLRGAGEAGDRLGDAGARAVSQVDRAHDAAAQGSLGRAVVVAQTLHAEQGSFPTDLATVAAADPSLTVTAGPSDGPTSISYALGQGGFAAAVRSDSGTCWWVRIDPAGVASYGSGAACTGSAAMAASAPGW
jgi:hypothetical protein